MGLQRAGRFGVWRLPAHLLAERCADVGRDRRADGNGDQAVQLTYAANTFSDQNPHDTLSVTATLANGDPLPSWLAFDPATGTFSGTPGKGNTGAVTIHVTATDTSGETALASFTLTVKSQPLPPDDGTIFNGTSGDDIIVGTTGNDTIYGGAGNDKLYGGAGNDVLYGGTGNDVLAGGSGNDRLFGGAGNDTIFGGAGNDTVYGGAGHDTLFGGAGNDKLCGGAGNDVLAGGSGNDVLGGGSGNDRLFGGAGKDTIYGGAGNDTLFGGTGNDRLIGGAGADKLYGGAGADVFVFTSIKDSTVAASGRDTIFDFSRKQGDKIDLKAIDADTGIAGLQAFRFIGADTFHNKAGELRYQKKGSDTFVYGDVDGDGKADFAIRFVSAIDFMKSDFLS
ncbi:MAG: putative Ig domain-containing protein [Shinella sp.]|nr:putative Ig domain-containing protein [Shinella sp.]